MKILSDTKFRTELAFFSGLVRKRQKGIHRRVAEMMRDSVVGNGSPHPVTNAPGQPVQTGNLRNSWILRFPEAYVALLTTKTIYAPGIEEGVSPRSGKALVLRSEVGGFHSVKMTRIAFPAMVRKATIEEKANG